MKVVYLPTLKTNGCNLHLNAAVGFDLQCAEILSNACDEVVFYLDEAQLDSYKKTIKTVAKTLGVKVETSFEKAIKGTSCAVGDFSNYIFAYLLTTKNPIINYMPIYLSVDLGDGDKYISLLASSGTVVTSKEELLAALGNIGNKSAVSIENVNKFLRGNII
jgi:hypothetical protein